MPKLAVGDEGLEKKAETKICTFKRYQTLIVLIDFN